MIVFFFFFFEGVCVLVFAFLFIFHHFESIFFFFFSCISSPPFFFFHGRRFHWLPADGALYRAQGEPCALVGKDRQGCAGVQVPSLCVRGAARRSEARVRPVLRRTHRAPHAHLRRLRVRALLQRHLLVQCARKVPFGNLGALIIGF